MEKSNLYRRCMLILAAIGLVISYVDRSAISFAILPIEKVLHLNDAQFGLIASAFAIGYMVMAVGGGALVDRFRVRKVWTTTAIIWSIVCIFLGIANGFWVFFILRMMLGLAEGPTFPALNRLVADWMLPKERGISLALGIAAAPFSFVIGAPLVSQLIAFTGYRTMFFVLGSLGVLWAIVWYLFYRDAVMQPSPIDTLSSSVIPQQSYWKFLLHSPALLANNYAYFSFSCILFFAMMWLPGYLQEVYKINLKQTG